MHPPFGFALFYLRGVADQVHNNKAIPRPVSTKDIYLGAIPWLCLQLLLVAVLIFWPESVTYWLEKEPQVNLDEVTIDVQIEDMGSDVSVDVPAVESDNVPLDVPAQ